MFKPLQKLLKYFRLLPCPVCGKGDGNGRNELCAACIGQLIFIDPDQHCPGCGGVLDGALAICRKCLREPKRAFLNGTTIFDYTGFGKILLWRFKKSGEVSIGRALGELASQNSWLKKWDFDLIIPLPLHSWDLAIRSFIQSQIIASIIAQRLGKPYNTQALKRIRRTKKQKLLDSDSRHLNVKDAFWANPVRLKGKRVLLVDDIFTTGATLNSATSALLNAGALKVYILTLARA